jgi:hypothetical protein
MECGENVKTHKKANNPNMIVRIEKSNKGTVPQSGGLHISIHQQL